MTNTYGSLFTGIGGFDLGFDRAGMECAWQVENDAGCNDVLARHWPGVQRYEDVRDVGKRNRQLRPVDLICGGFPCQDVSVAGNRKGLDAERSGLWFEFLRILQELTPQWCVIENVPGLLSSNGGADFHTILQGLAECGYNAAWRVLDAQYFGVAQRRRRVFIVGHLRGAGAAEVLFEPESGKWDTAPGRETGAQVAAPIVERTHKGGFTDTVNDNIIVGTLAASGAGSARPAGQGNETDMIVVTALDIRNLREQPGNVSGTLQAKKTGGHSFNYVNPVLCFEGQNSIAQGMTIDSEIAPPHRVNAVTDVLANHVVRRLTPTECERLQGFPDGWTAGQSDSRRYRQLGNAVAVPVAEWIAWQVLGCTRELVVSL